VRNCRYRESAGASDFVLRLLWAGRQYPVLRESRVQGREAGECKAERSRLETLDSSRVRRLSAETTTALPYPERLRTPPSRWKGLKIGATGEALEGVVVRYRVRAELGGRRFEEVMVDIGFLDPLKWKPELNSRTGSSGIRRHRTDQSASPAARTTHRREGARIHQNLQSSSPGQSRKGPCRSCPGEAVHGAERGTPSQRSCGHLRGPASTRSSGSAPPPPTEWDVPYRRLAKEVALDRELRTGYLQAAALLDPVLAGRTVGRWDPQGASWT